MATDIVTEKGLTRRLWTFRPQSGGNFTQILEETATLTAEFGVRLDLSEHFEKEAIVDAVADANPDEKSTKVKSMATQLNALVNEMQPGDIVLCVMRNPARYYLAMLKPGLSEDAEGRPARKLEWLRQDIPKDSLLPDMIHSADALTHISEIRVPDAVERMRILMRDGGDPGPGKSVNNFMNIGDLRHQNRLRIAARFGSVFAGHRLSELVTLLLEIEGFKVACSPPGPDGGVDVRAGHGPLGLGVPRLVGQVKSGSQVVNDEVLQALIGHMHTGGADAALVVSWAGLTRQAAGRAAGMGFRVQVWDSNVILDRFIEAYDRLPSHVRSLLPQREEKIMILDDQLQ